MTSRRGVSTVVLVWGSVLAFTGACVSACGDSSNEGTGGGAGAGGSTPSGGAGGTSSAGMAASGAGMGGASNAGRSGSGAAPSAGSANAGRAGATAGGSDPGGTGGAGAGGGGGRDGSEAGGNAGTSEGNQGGTSGANGGAAPECEPPGEPDGSGVKSCHGIAETCGPEEDESCCDSPLVPGGTFDRINDSRYPATVSSFRFDRFETTLGRFKTFVACYPDAQPSAGSGKNPNDPDDLGWDPAWNAELPADRAALEAALACEANQTWGNDEERLPMNCVSWYVAQAFCIWDGGRLPTEAEWNYAAAGGDDQRYYPWSDPPADMTIDAAYAVLKAPLLPVGSKSATGDGRFGQADLSASVTEWVIDYGYSAIDYPVPCVDCANFEPGQNASRGFRGGAFGDPAELVSTTAVASISPSGRSAVRGVRCVRAP